MDNVINLIKPNKKDKLNTVEFRLLAPDFFEKYREITSQTRFSPCDLVVSCIYKNNSHGRHEVTRRQLYHISFTDYDTQNGDIDYLMVTDDVDIDEDEEVIFVTDIETVIAIIKEYECAEHFSIVIF